MITSRLFNVECITMDKHRVYTTHVQCEDITLESILDTLDGAHDYLDLPNYEEE